MNLNNAYKNIDKVFEAYTEFEKVKDEARNDDIFINQESGDITIFKIKTKFYIENYKKIPENVKSAFISVHEHFLGLPGKADLQMTEDSIKAIYNGHVFAYYFDDMTFAVHPKFGKRVSYSGSLEDGLKKFDSLTTEAQEAIELQKFNNVNNIKDFVKD